jgi:hypothetical protein
MCFTGSTNYFTIDPLHQTKIWFIQDIEVIVWICSQCTGPFQRLCEWTHISRTSRSVNNMASCRTNGTYKRNILLRAVQDNLVTTGLMADMFQCINNESTELQLAVLFMDNNIFDMADLYQHEWWWWISIRDVPSHFDVRICVQQN